MSRFSIGRRMRDGQELVGLHDGKTGAAAQIWPGCGNNCLSLTLPSPAGKARLVTVIQDPPAVEEIRKRPSWWGIPLLFPFPGTIPGGEYEFEGRTLRLGRPEQPIVSEGKEFPGARRDYHGFVMDLPWTVAEEHADDLGVTVRSTLNSRDFPEAHEGFPFPYQVEATYTLDADGLRLDFLARNSGRGRLPFGFGAHPFFKVPLGPIGSAEECLVSIPAAQRWNNRVVRESLARGEGGPKVARDEVLMPVPEDIDLRQPRPFVPQTYNGMYTGLVLADGKVEAFIRDPHNSLETVMRASAEFPNVVFWSPPGRPELCFEPWICPSNVFNLAARGVPGNGMVVLEPGQTWNATMWISLRGLRA
ncbi:MAG TPA: aldose 1-epimerase [Chloroflexota bacterium]|nr:aldose 1-epimerase [Chloroflexota bacterium]